MKVVRIQVQNASGQPLQGLSVSLAGCGDALTTNADGNVQFLPDGSSGTIIEIGGAKAWSGSTADLKSSEVFKQSGASFVRV